MKIRMKISKKEMSEMEAKLICILLAEIVLLGTRTTVGIGKLDGLIFFFGSYWIFKDIFAKPFTRLYRKWVFK